VFVASGSASGLFVGTVHDWAPEPGRIVSWQASPESLEKAMQAPTSDVPISAMQEGHLRGFARYAAQGLDYARLVIGSGDEPGRCDVRVMTYVINSHLRRHKTYHSWFEFADGERIVRHTFNDPADIEFRPVTHEPMTPGEWQRFVLSTPVPVQWDCFRFGIIQRADHFEFFSIVDHLHCDPTIISGLYTEILMNYRSLVKGSALAAVPPPSSHDDFCVREKQLVSALSADSPEVRRWIDFAEKNSGTLPDFPLPLGDLSRPTGGDLVVGRLLDQEQTAQFESLCVAAGARMSGGLFACVALAQYELTGATTYYGLAPIDKRKSLAEFATMGWFTGVVPFTVPVNPKSFDDTARAAQASFDSNLDLANVSFNEVLKLAPRLRPWGANCTMINYMDAGLPPFSATVSAHMKHAKARIYCDPRDPAHLYFSVIRLFDEVSIWVNFPKNPIARESVTRYLGAMVSVIRRVVEGRLAVTPVTELAYTDGN
jgi:mycolipenoyl-CoA---2-(long-chain-fatty acyl)-trehalose mycolipenoyltransferase / long-chain-acyl-CoA---trehalose acyltransferase